MITHKIDAVEMLNRLHAQHGKGLFQLIDETYQRMIEDDRFFCDDLGCGVDMVYEPTTEENTILHGPVWTYFADHDFFTRGTELSHRERAKQRDEDDELEDYELEFTHDLAELLLVLDGQVSFEVEVE
jgi:hypothetical protein